MAAFQIANSHLTLEPDNGLIGYLAELTGKGVEELMEDKQLMSFFKEKKGKRTVQSHERAVKPVDDMKCMCRVWVGVDKSVLEGSGYPAGKVGYAVQCNAKKKVGDFCGRCSQKSDEKRWLGIMSESIGKGENHEVKSDKGISHWVLNDEEGNLVDISELEPKQKKSGGRPKKVKDEKKEDNSEEMRKEIERLQRQLKEKEQQQEENIQTPIPEDEDEEQDLDGTLDLEAIEKAQTPEPPVRPPSPSTNAEVAPTNAEAEVKAEKSDSDSSSSSSDSDSSDSDSSSSDDSSDEDDK